MSLALGVSPNSEADHVDRLKFIRGDTPMSTLREQLIRELQSDLLPGSAGQSGTSVPGWYSHHRSPFGAACMRLIVLHLQESESETP